MNLLAKHFFDYQSFINLPHKAVQLHKTPPSQAGVDLSAAWAPKSMHLAGKNQAAPAAHANRSRVEPRTDGHRHGRPNKLEFRSWGDRHGELHAEKIIPHQDEWMMNLGGEFKHFYKQDESFGFNGVESAIQHFPTFSQRCVEVGDLEVLTILTLTARSDVITVTVKVIRGFSHFKNRPSVKIQLFDGDQLVEDRPPRQLEPWRDSSVDKPDPRNHNEQQHFAASAPHLYQVTTVSRRRLSRAPARITEAQVPRPLQPFRSHFQTQSLRRGDDIGTAGGSRLQHFYSLASLRRYQSHAEPIYRLVVPPSGEMFALEAVPKSAGQQPIRVQLNQNGCPPSSQRQARPPSLERGVSLGDRPIRQFSSPPLSNSTTTVADDSLALSDNPVCRWVAGSRRDVPATDVYDNKTVTELGDSFMMRVPRSRLAQCHLLIQIFSCTRSQTPPPSPSSLNLLKNTTFGPQRASSEFLNDDMTSNGRPTNSVSRQLAEALIDECLQRAIGKLAGALGNVELVANGPFRIDGIQQMIDQSSNSNEAIWTTGTRDGSSLPSAATAVSQRRILVPDCRIIETPPQFISSSSKDSADSSADSMLEELELLDDGPPHGLLRYSEFYEEEDVEDFSSAVSAATVPLPQRSRVSDDSALALVGGFVIGPLGSSRGRWHWRQMVQRQGHPVFMWHRVMRPERLI